MICVWGVVVLFAFIDTVDLYDYPCLPGVRPLLPLAVPS